MTSVDPLLQRELDALAPPGLLIGHRLISPGDEEALLGEEAVSIASTVVGARRASGAARIVARALLAQLGHPRAPLPKSASGAPAWPAGIAGSLAHDDEVAVAAVGRQRDIGSVGIDVEPAVMLPPDMLELIATPTELGKIADDPLRGKLLFAAKEAVYKAVYPLERVFLEFRDIEVDLGRREAVTRSGRVVALRYGLSPRVVVLALA
ncbi:MAG TPA: 4'-phosphopantetheinyl transferase superfamily protein [Xanthobacteraceae bacterium]|nr:4'-phosphopantetheinyl transferase superfamily protein [Xanthobacteraceae bacterium]